MDLENAHHCFLSHTLYNKSYYFENIHYTEEEYFQKIHEFTLLTEDQKKKKIDNWIISYKTEKVYPYHLSVSFENSYGSGLKNVKN